MTDTRLIQLRQERERLNAELELWANATQQLRRKAARWHREYVAEYGYIATAIAGDLEMSCNTFCTAHGVTGDRCEWIDWLSPAIAGDVMAYSRWAELYGAFQAQRDYADELAASRDMSRGL